MLILDTDQLPARERAEAFQAAISGHASTSLAVFDDEETVRAKLHVYDFGAGRVFNVDATGNQLRRTPSMARRDEQNTIAIAVPTTGRNQFQWGREQAVLNAGVMLLVDLDAPYQYGWHGTGSSYAFQVDREELDVPMDTVHDAATRLQASPLYSLVRDRLLHTTLNAEQLAVNSSASRVGTSNVDLLRALIVSASTKQTTRSAFDGSILMCQVLDYVRRHLVEPDLTPERIAAAHHISVRYLYRLGEQNRISIERWIVDHRLEASKAALATPADVNRSISSVALSHGFTNPSFFAARFKGAYGVTPRRWRTLAAHPESADAALKLPPIHERRHRTSTRV